MRVGGSVRVPGDKSITHRTLLLGALAGGFVAHAAGLRAPYIAAGLVCGVCLLVAVPLLLASAGAASRD